MREARRIARWAVVMLVALFLSESEAAVNPRAIAILPFDASALERDDQWIGQGVPGVVRLGLAQQPALSPVDEARVRAGRPESWGGAAVTQAARTLRADTAVFGQVSRSGTDLVVQPRLMQVKGGRVETVPLDPITIPESGQLLRLLAPLPGLYARTLKVALTDAETRRMEA